MDVEQAIATRRMVGKVKDLIPSRGEIEKLLAAAVAAPNHHLTEPWRFIVLTGEALDELGEAMALRVGEKYPEAPDLADRVGRELARPKRAPIIIAVLYVPSSHPKAIDMEDRYAVGAAVENLLLVAHGMGLGAFWRSGPASQDPGVRSFLGLSEHEDIAGFIYVGYPAEDRPSAGIRRSRDFESRTTWLGWPSA